MQRDASWSGVAPICYSCLTLKRTLLGAGNCPLVSYVSLSETRCKGMGVAEPFLAGFVSFFFLKSSSMSWTASRKLNEFVPVYETIYVASTFQSRHVRN